MTQATQPKVLIVAANASSQFGGEAFLPLKYFQILKKRGYPAKLLTHARNRDDLNNTLSPFMDDIHFIEDTIFHRIVWHIGSLFPGRLAENLTRLLLDEIDNIYQAKPIRTLLSKGHVDLIHQPIPVSPLAPSSLHKFGKPLIIGPMNGNMNFPPGYSDYEKPIERLLVKLARKFAPLANRLSPGKRRAQTLLVANERTREALRFLKHPKIIELVENGVDIQLFQDRTSEGQQDNNALRLVYMGRMPRLKALDITLEAVALARSKGANVTFDILGDGSERSSLEVLTRGLGLTEYVRFHGFQTQDRCAEILRDSGALILNSLRECGGAVVLEAMSIGLPVIAIDWGGPADYIDPSCGILVPPVPRNRFAERLSDAIVLLAGDSALRTKMGAAGAQKIRDRFDWEKKMDAILKIYEDAAKAA